MNRKFLYVGVCVLIVGLICLLIAEFFLKGLEYEEVPGTRAEGSWTFTTFLSSGTTYWLYIEAGDKWGEPFLQGLTDDPQPVWINITSSDGNFTIIQALFYGLPPSSPYFQEVSLAVVNVKCEIKSSDLYVIEGSSNIRFIVKNSGYYTFSVVKAGLAKDSPPNYMMLYKEVILTEKLYSIFVLGGGLTCTVGILTTFLGVIKKEKVKHKKKIKK